MTLTDEYQRALDDVVDLSLADLGMVLGALSWRDRRAATDVLLATVPAIVRQWGAVGAQVSAVFYAELRAEAIRMALDGGVSAPGLVSTRPRSVLPARPVAVESAEALVRWSTEPVWALDDVADDALVEAVDAATSRVQGGVVRRTLEPARETMIEAARTDDLDVKFQRVARAGACDFCRMLASRGAVYHTDVTAGKDTVTGQMLRWHDRCKCRVEPVFVVSDRTRLGESKLARRRYSALQAAQAERADAIDAARLQLVAQAGTE